MQQWCTNSHDDDVIAKNIQLCSRLVEYHLSTTALFTTVRAVCALLHLLCTANKNTNCANKSSNHMLSSQQLTSFFSIIIPILFHESLLLYTDALNDNEDDDLFSLLLSLLPDVIHQFPSFLDSIQQQINLVHYLQMIIQVNEHEHEHDNDNDHENESVGAASWDAMLQM